MAPRRNRREPRVVQLDPAVLAAEESKTAAYRAVFGTPEGMFVRRDLAKYCGLNRICMVAGQDGERLTAFALGRRVVSLYIEETVNGRRISGDRRGHAGATSPERQQPDAGAGQPEHRA